MWQTTISNWHFSIASRVTIRPKVMATTKTGLWIVLLACLPTLQLALYMFQVMFNGRGRTIRLQGGAGCFFNKITWPTHGRKLASPRTCPVRLEKIRLSWPKLAAPSPEVQWHIPKPLYTLCIQQKQTPTCLEVGVSWIWWGRNRVSYRTAQITVRRLTCSFLGRQTMLGNWKVQKTCDIRDLMPITIWKRF